MKSGANDSTVPDKARIEKRFTRQGKDSSNEVTSRRGNNTNLLCLDKGLERIPTSVVFDKIIIDPVGG
jgi:hypothetical protein